MENHAYQLCLSVEGIEHIRTKTCHPQTNGIVERFHRTMKQEFYDIAFRKKNYNYEHPHSGGYFYGKTPYWTFLDSKHIALEKANESMYKRSASDSCNLCDS
jgi:transposase InsO family protein